MRPSQAILFAGVFGLLAGCQTGEALDSVSTSAALPPPSASQDESAETMQVATANDISAESDNQLQPEVGNGVGDLAGSNIPVPTAAPETMELASTAPIAATSEQALLETPVAPLADPISGQSQVAIQPADPVLSPTRSNEAVLASLPDDTIAPVTVAPRTRKTFLINGLFSAVPFIGYGFRNLHKKMPDAILHSYISPVESNAVIMPQVMKEIESAYAADPNVAINLIGISLGADFVTVVAEKLNKKGIPVNYLGIVDGTSLRPITPNVVKADNLTCTFLDCTRGRARLAKGNTTTIFTQKKYKSSHIPLGDNADLHARVIAQSNS